ncbi:MAG: hypothetical protein ACE5GM_07950 [bacterium]
MEKPASVLLSEADVMTVETLLLDQDEQEALRFIREVLHPKIKESQGDHCEAWT